MIHIDELNGAPEPERKRPKKPQITEQEMEQIANACNVLVRHLVSVQYPQVIFVVNEGAAKARIIVDLLDDEGDD